MCRNKLENQLKDTVDGEGKALVIQDTNDIQIQNEDSTTAAPGNANSQIIIDNESQTSSTNTLRHSIL